MKKVLKANYLAFDNKIIGLLKYFLRPRLTHEQGLIQSLSTESPDSRTKFLPEILSCVQCIHKLNLYYLSCSEVFK